MSNLFINLAIASAFLFTLLLTPKQVMAANGCRWADTNSTCSATEVLCSTTNGNLCCGDGLVVGNQECAFLQKSPTDPSGVGTPSQIMGKFNNVIFGASFYTKDFTTPRGIISYLLPYIFTVAGLILFVMIIWGGFEMLTGATNPKSQEAGKQRLTAGVIGFLLIFSAYWLAQLLQTIFGISILK